MHDNLLKCYLIPFSFVIFHHDSLQIKNIFMTRLLSTEDIKNFNEDGYVIKPQFFSKEEIDKLYTIAVDDNVVRKHAVDLNDQTGKKTKLTLWFSPGNDIYSLLIRSERMVNSVS